VPQRPDLGDELLARAERELAAADALFARIAEEPVLEAELERHLAGEVTPLSAALHAWEERPTEGTALLEINAENVEWLSAQVEELAAWPGLRLVGADATDAAWLLAQHADTANELRRGWLPRIADAVASGDADPRHLSSLTDRCAAVAGEPQRFGSLARLDANGNVEFVVPIDDEVSLDDRRAAIGLPPVAVDAVLLEIGDVVPFGADRGAHPLLQWPLVVEGHVSVEAVLEAGMRPVHRIWAVRPGDRRLVRLRALARERDVVIERVESDVVDELSAGRTHGGVLALVGPRVDRAVDELLAEVGEGSLIVMLDGIEDPFNFGQAVRALYAAGVSGLVVRRSWETALPIVARASAGTTELLPTARAADADEAADLCRRAGYRIACAVTGADASDLTEADLTGALFLLIGGERRGVTRSFVDRADVRVRIGYGRERAPELGAAIAAAIVGFEALRQRRQG
jgi:23S rRNA (guanosine2251-2'-O)-methyltransferase